MPSTDPEIRNRVQRWYIVVQARRLVDAGYTKTDAAKRLGITRRSIGRWAGDEELWRAAAVAPDREAVGPPKGRDWRPLEVLASAADEAERAGLADRASRPPPARQSPQEPPPRGGPVGPRVSDSGTPSTTPDDSTEADARARTRDDDAGDGGAGRGDDGDEDGDGDEAHDEATDGGATPRGAGNGTGGAGHEGAGHGGGTRAGHEGPAVRSAGQPPRNRPNGSNPPSAPPSVPAHRDAEDRRRYDGLAGTRTGDALARHRVDPNPLDTTPELDLARAALERYILRAEDTLCVHCGRGFEADPAVVGGLVEKISRAADRVIKARQADSIPRGEFLRFMADLGRSIRRHCDEDTAAAIRDDVLSFKP